MFRKNISAVEEVSNEPNSVKFPFTRVNAADEGRGNVRVWIGQVYALVASYVDKDGCHCVEQIMRRSEV